MPLLYERNKMLAVVGCWLLDHYHYYFKFKTLQHLRLLVPRAFYQCTAGLRTLFSLCKQHYPLLDSESIFSRGVLQLLGEASEVWLNQVQLFPNISNKYLLLLITSFSNLAIFFNIKPVHKLYFHLQNTKTKHLIVLERSDVIKRTEHSENYSITKLLH